MMRSKETFGRSVGAALAFVWLIAFSGIAHAADGDLDPAFGGGGDGKVRTTFPQYAFANAVAIASDGKIVAAGAAAGPDVNGVFAVARYDSDGLLDPTFGGDGRAIAAITPAGGDEANGVLVQPDGKVVAAGTAGRAKFAIARFDADGTLDATFGNAGVRRTDITAGDDIATQVLMQTDGKIVVVGYGGVNRPSFALARYDSDGVLDPTFGNGGIVLTPFGLWGIARAAVLQPNGKIVAAGGNGRGWSLARYLPDGSLDHSFGNLGKVVTKALTGDAFAVGLQPDGKIVATGAYDFYKFAAARYTPHGRLDPTFSHDGTLTTNVGGGGEQVSTGVAIQANGKILATGSAGPHEFGDPDVWHFVVMRYRSNGVRDPSFGGDGEVVTTFKGGANAAAAAMQADGRLVVAGGFGAGNADGFALARYLL